MMTRFALSLSLCAALVALAACDKPNAFPKGYTNQGAKKYLAALERQEKDYTAQSYQAASAPLPVLTDPTMTAAPVAPVDSAYAVPAGTVIPMVPEERISLAPPEMSAPAMVMNPAQSEQFRRAVYQLVESLTLRAGMPPKPVYVLQPDGMPAFYITMDNSVRESLEHIGYHLAVSPNDAYIITYTAQPLSAPGPAPLPGALAPANIRLALQVHDSLGGGSRMLTEEAGTFYIAGAESLPVEPATFSGVTIVTSAGR